jgi:hypothetical protein
MIELFEILSAMASKKKEVADQLELYLDIGERVAKTMAGVFNTQQDEVALLILSRDGRHLRFVAPRKLAALGSIPLSKRDSIAVGVLQKKSPELMNNVPMVRHVSFFESIKLRDKVVPIQKMVSVPILHDQKAIGVAQISRKGESAAAAGPDFTEADVRKAQEIFGDIAPFLSRARPDDY